MRRLLPGERPHDLLGRRGVQPGVRPRYPARERRVRRPSRSASTRSGVPLLRNRTRRCTTHPILGSRTPTHLSSGRQGCSRPTSSGALLRQGTPFEPSPWVRILCSPRCIGTRSHPKFCPAPGYSATTSSGRLLQTSLAFAMVAGRQKKVAVTCAFGHAHPPVDEALPVGEPGRIGDRRPGTASHLAFAPSGLPAASRNARAACSPTASRWAAQVFTSSRTRSTVLAIPG